MPQSGAVNTSKLNAYAVLDTNATEVSKLNVYAVLATVTLLSADTGSFSVAGVSAGKVQNYRLSAASGSVALTGIGAYLPNPRMFFSGPFVVTGQSATFRYNRIFLVSAGSFALTGQSASGGKGKSLLAESRQFTLTGKNAVIGRNSTLDPFRNYVVYLHHCDSRTESVLGQNVIPIGNAVISSSTPKFGTGSFALDGVGDYFYSPNRPGFAFGTAPFTMEAWFRFNTAQTDATLMQQMGGWKFGLVSGQISFWANNNNVQSGTAAFTPTPGQWHNITVDRDASNVLRIYVDGTMVVKTTGYNEVVGGSSASLWLGTGDSYFNGRIDEIRLTNGVARYASDAGFTPATQPFSFASLSAAAGSAAFTGNAATFTRTGPLLKALPAAYTLQGGEARFRPLDAGSFALTGRNATLRYTIPTRLSAAAGAIALVGVSAALDKRKAILGGRASYSLTARPATFLYNQRLSAAPTAFALTGQAARPFLRLKVFPAPGAFAFAGGAALFRRNRGLLAAPGAFALTGVAADRITARKVFPAPGAFALAGGVLGSLRNRRLRSQPADFSLVTVSARLLEHHRVAANSQQFDVTGKAASLERGWRLPASAGVFVWAGVSAKRSMVRTGRTGRFQLTGQGADLWAGWGGDAVGGVSSPVATAGVVAQGTARGSVAAPQARATWSDR